MHIRFALLPITLILALAACETTYKKSPVVTPQPMSCTGGIPASITLYSPDDAKLTFEGKSHNLRRAESASGIKYSNGGVSYWNKGIEALITRSDGSVTTCTYIPKAGL